MKLQVNFCIAVKIRAYECKRDGVCVGENVGIKACYYWRIVNTWCFK